MYSPPMREMSYRQWLVGQILAGIADREIDGPPQQEDAAIAYYVTRAIKTADEACRQLQADRETNTCQHTASEDCLICCICGKCDESLDEDDVCYECGGG